MKIKFLGAMEKRQGGCRPCGTRRASKRVMATRKEYMLLSGASHVFYAGRIAEVSDEDGRFLVDSFPESFKEVV